MPSHVFNMNDPVVLRAMGALVRKWVLKDKVPVGDSKGALKDMYKAGITLQDKDGNELERKHCPIKVIVHQNSEDEFHIVVPAKEQLEDILDRVENDPGYTLDQEFMTFLMPPAKTKEQRMSFYDFRLGDYVLQHCD
ncbi:hypothetical protein FDP22_24130 (plasmid) [Paroceanicella profunda]|uniref:Uncharacterized protein n=1 Tax=Paroceanicella profunda TaxID=2579971 RepID=A0A5B8FJJ6_9RHOB|nr:hypothetical protein [Paroceanicella profunda]QDL94951.1 hypothetical protein FDP22_24130 [Paroceanicella profunda]